MVDSTLDVLVAAAIRAHLTTHGDTVHGLRRGVMTLISECKVEDFNAALVDLIDVGVVKISGTSFGHAVFVM